VPARPSGKDKMESGSRRGVENCNSFKCCVTMQCVPERKPDASVLQRTVMLGEYSHFPLKYFAVHVGQKAFAVGAFSAELQMIKRCAIRACRWPWRHLNCST
jgi:hypothetical protein